MEITVKLITSPEGIKGLEDGCKGEEFFIVSSPNKTKVDLVTPKGEKFTINVQELRQALSCCTTPEYTISTYPWWRETIAPPVYQPIITSTGTVNIPTQGSTCSSWDCTGTCACTNVDKVEI